MIANEQEYEFTKEWLEKFERKLAAPLLKDDPIDPRLRQIERDSITATIEDLRQQLAEYEACQRQLQPAGRG